MGLWEVNQRPVVPECVAEGDESKQLAPLHTLLRARHYECVCLRRTEKNV
jgi:hypothetical protein